MFVINPTFWSFHNFGEHFYIHCFRLDFNGVQSMLYTCKWYILSSQVICKKNFQNWCNIRLYSNKTIINTLELNIICLLLIHKISTTLPNYDQELYLLVDDLKYSTDRCCTERQRGKIFLPEILKICNNTDRGHFQQKSDFTRSVLFLTPWYGWISLNLIMLNAEFIQLRVIVFLFGNIIFFVDYICI